MTNELDLLEIIGGKRRPKKGSHESPVANLLEYYLNGPIEAAEEYVEWFQEIRHARELDVIKIYINSPGGDLMTAIQFMSVMKETNAHVVCRVEGDCSSAATMIFLSADTIEIAPHSTFMFHNYSSGMIGKGGEMLDQITHQTKWARDLLVTTYKDFLSEKEIQSILDNKDIWMDGAEVVHRLNEKNKLQEKKSKKKTSESNEGS